MDLFRRAFGALPDAAWLRRQFTADADLVHDLRHSARMLRKSAAFTASAVVILALGIGGTVSIVTILDALMFRPLSYAAVERVVTLWQRSDSRASELEDVAPANFVDWRERSRSFSHMAAAVPYSRDYTGAGEPEVFFGAQVTEGFWEALGVTPVLGRVFRAEEYGSKSRVAIITYGLWQRRFGGNPAIIDTVISLDQEPWTVVGVLPQDFSPRLLGRPGELDVWTPKSLQDPEVRVRGSAWWNVVARLAPGVTIDQAQSELTTISQALAQEYPRTNRGVTTRVVPFREHLMGGVRLPLFVMLGAVVAVLVIGCSNVASLLLARGIEREREFAIRSALGAGRGRLIRQLVAESLLLSTVAAVAGVAFAQWTIGVIVALAPAGIFLLQQAAINGRMLAFAAGLTALTSVAFGVLPALQFSSPESSVIRERHATGPRTIFRRSLVAAEVALALVLLTGAGLLIRSFGRLLSVDPGFSPHNVVALQVFAWDRNGRPDRTRAFFDGTLDRIRALPGVQAAGAVSAMPFISADIDIKSPFEIIGQPAATESDRRAVYITIVTSGFFETMSIPLREGRYLARQDHERAPKVAVITEALRRREWPTESPVGKRIRVQWNGKPLEPEVIGVVGEIRHQGLASQPRAEVFLPLSQANYAGMTYAVRGSGDPAALIAAVKREIWAVDALQTFYDVATVPALVQASVVRQRFSVSILSAFAFVALILCATGIYGIVSFTTTQRTREIGLRMALGADGASIRRMVLREGTALIGSGIVIGLLGAAASVRFLQTLLFETRPGDPLTYTFVSFLLATVGLLACYVPARRATRVDPIVALRVE